MNSLDELVEIGIALSTERDLLKLLDLILSQARRITHSDAGSLYLVERSDDEDAPPRGLRFKLSQNDTIPNLPLQEFTIPLDSTSVAGYAATTGELVNLEDVYKLPAGTPYTLNKSFDEKFGYKTRSMLVVPMKSRKDELMGVLQLINSKNDKGESQPYAKESIKLAQALASQAGVAIENSILHEDIEKLFEGFVRASVTAIEARDPTTSGHSERVATYTVGLADALMRRGGSDKFNFTNQQLREIRYASLLHDFGKVGVRENVLVKEKKLYPESVDLIQHRFALLKKQAELEFERSRADHLLRFGRDRYEQALLEMEGTLRLRLSELDGYLQAVIVANEPTVLEQGVFEHLKMLGGIQYEDVYGKQQPLLNENELTYLCIRKGTLDEEERLEIESHVTHTYRFLRQIPWTRELRGVTDIAYGHHEKLNGKGYPRRLAGDEIPVQTRMMTISDIYDALTAQDRPYKRALPKDRALDILTQEAKDGFLDNELLDVFIGAKIFEIGAS